MDSDTFDDDVDDFSAGVHGSGDDDSDDDHSLSGDFSEDGTDEMLFFKEKGQLIGTVAIESGSTLRKGSAKLDMGLSLHGADFPV